MKTRDELRELHGAEYVATFERRQAPARLARLIRHLQLGEQAAVVDFGCGNGMLMEHLAPRVASYIGVDFSPPFIDAALARQRRLGIENAAFVCSSIEAFCSQHQEAFDVGLAMDLSEHVYDQEWIGILRNVHGSLKHDGRFYLHTPNAGFFLEMMKARGLLLRQFPEHVAVRTPAHNVVLLEQAGFDVRQVRLLAHYNVLRYLHPLSHVPFVGKYLQARILIEAVK